MTKYFKLSYPSLSGLCLAEIAQIRDIMMRFPDYNINSFLENEFRFRIHGVDEIEIQATIEKHTKGERIPRELCFRPFSLDKIVRDALSLGLSHRLTPVDTFFD